MADQFLLKSSHPVEACLPADRGFAIESHASLAETLRSRIGPDAAALFAEPYVSRDKTGQTVQIAWYGRQGSGPHLLTGLEPAARRAVEDRLHLLIPRIEALAQDPLIRAALSLSSSADILSVGGHPVLVNWGLRSTSGEDPLAGYLTQAETPALPAAPAAAAVVAPAVAAGSAQAAAGGAVPAFPPAGLPPSAPPPSAPPAAAVRANRLPAIAWVPLAALLGLAALVLLWVLWPGTRIYPAAAPLSIAGAEAGARSELDALRARRDALQAALSGAQCRADGRLVLPGNISPDGMSVPALWEEMPQTPVPTAPDSPVAPSPSRVAVPAPGAAPGAAKTASLLESVEASTVLVLAATEGSISTGSGFAVGPGLILTNFHVIEGVLPGRLFVINQRLGQAVPATVLKSDGPFEATGKDFALLQIENRDLPALPMADPQAAQKLSHVVAAGFPGDVMETDAAFNRLMEGDGAAIPDLVVVDGTINALQEMDHGASVILHSAPLSSGNSGGPLVDFCGRLLGVNTFVREGPLRTLNFALAVPTLAGFLSGTPVTATPETGACDPRVSPPPFAPPDAAGGDAAQNADTAPVLPELPALAPSPP